MATFDKLNDLRTRRENLKRVAETKELLSSTRLEKDSQRKISSTFG